MAHQIAHLLQCMTHKPLAVPLQKKMEDRAESAPDKQDGAPAEDARGKAESSTMDDTRKADGVSVLPCGKNLPCA